MNGVLSIRRGVLPGFRLSLGVSLTFIVLLLLIPVAALVAKGGSQSPAAFWTAVSSPRAVAAFRVSLIAAAAAAAINTLLGLATAWVLERQPFPGRGLVDMLIDVPFALPTSVAGITLATLYGPNGFLGRLLDPLGIRVAYTQAGIVVALVFVTVPFAVRTLQPVIRDLDPEVEDAAESLGSSRLTTFLRVTLPELRPAIVTAFALSFARGIGEYGSVIFIAGNMPMRTETIPLLIMIHLDQFEYATATAIALTYLVAALLLLTAVQSMQWRRR